MASKRELSSEDKSLKREAEQTMRELGLDVVFGVNEITKDGEQTDKDWKGCWKEFKGEMQTRYKKQPRSSFPEKSMQSQVLSGQDEENALWLQTNITPHKTSGILEMMKEMVETRKWRAVRGLGGEDSRCRLYKKHDEIMHYLLSGCEVIAGTVGIVSKETGAASVG